MEEKKLAKKIPLNTKREKEEQKLSYEQLNDACMQLHQQNQKLMAQMHQMNQSIMFKRLDYLFEVLRYEHVIKDADFVASCVQEIKEALEVNPEEE